MTTPAESGESTLSISIGEVKLEAIAIASSAFERTCLLALLVETSGSYTLTELVNSLSGFLQEQGAKTAKPTLSTGQASWHLGKLKDVNLVIVAGKKYTATPMGAFVYKNFIRDAFLYSLIPEIDPDLRRMAPQRPSGANQVT